MEDVYPKVKSAIERGLTGQLLYNWNADPSIELGFNELPIVVKQSAFFGKTDSISSVAELAKRTGKEVPFATSLVGDTVGQVFVGKLGSYGLCDWERGDLLERALNSDGLVSLGHTHPRNCGAICSDAMWNSWELSGLGAIGKRLRESNHCDTYGGDYVEMLIRSRDKGFSDLFWILSPRKNHAGVFQIKEKGKVIYRPWHID